MDKIPLVIKKSMRYSFSFIAGISTIAGIGGYTLKDINNNWKWWQCGIILFVIFIILSFIVGCIINNRKHKSYSTTINGISVEIKVGDIFKEKGLKIIPFNERFDTKVDDIIIAHNSLNGKMIDNYIDNIEDLNLRIEDAKTENSLFKPEKANGKNIYPLGRIIKYDDFLMLAFSHFDEQNNAYIKIGEYEQLLIRMWNEIRRVYAGKPIVIPLLGCGITTIEGISNKNYTEFLKCILCTLRSSKFQTEQEIKIVLTENSIKK